MNRRQWLRTALAAGGVLLPTAVAAVPSRSLWDHDFGGVRRVVAHRYSDGSPIVNGARLYYVQRLWGGERYAINICPRLRSDGRLDRELFAHSISQTRMKMQQILDFYGPSQVVESEWQIETVVDQFEAVDIERGLLLGPVAVR